MAYAKPQVGTGTTIAFGTTSAYNSTALEWDSFNIDGVSTPSVDTTHLTTTGGRTFIPGDLYDGGTMSASCFADTNVPPVTVHLTETITLTVPITDDAHGTGGTISFPGYIESYSTTFPLEDAVKHEVTIKIAGTITYADSTT